MIKKLIGFSLLFLSLHTVIAQPDTTQFPLLPKMIFISDTQQPMFVEKIFLKSNSNLKATAAIFDTIIKQKPVSVYMLGDIVALGYENSKWRKVDLFLDSCRKLGIKVNGALGNHDVMGRTKKGEKNFLKRFPLSVRTGYVSVTDSVAVVLLNSNFKKLSAADIKKQDDWYKAALAKLDTTNAIKTIIVCCHHAPYTNSKIVGNSFPVQQHFVPDYILSKKAKLFITGHAHAFEHFKIQGKDFLVIGGGGGLHQPLDTSTNSRTDLSANYKPSFHYLSVKRVAESLLIESHFLKNDFTRFENGDVFIVN